MKGFPCTECGACCRRAGMTGLMPSKEDGSCIYLNKDNRCDIYHQRPAICNISKMYKQHKLQGTLPQDTSKKDYYKLNANVCNQFIEEDNLDDKYKIDVESI
jgi:Fe-S-cluster containining protein